jgi:molybdopterin-guanine dinucleotide biosynthesis protein A
MTDKFARMNCYLIASDGKADTDGSRDGESFKRLEKSYQRYASIFENVSLVLNPELAREGYLDFPHVCKKSKDICPVESVALAIKNANSEAVFIGSADISDFPLELAVKLVREYNGESFLGYRGPSDENRPTQPLFGIYSKKMAAELTDLDSEDSDRFMQLLGEVGKLMPISDSSAAAQIGID